jgi:hypothetical protein
MWRETDIAGVLLSPLLIYAGAAFVLWLPVQYAFEHLRLDHWTANPLLALVALYICILGLLVVLL